MTKYMINPFLVRQVLNKSADQANALDFIFQELASRVVSRLDYIKVEPQNILECGSGLGYDQVLLARKYPKARLIELDFALNLLQLHKKKESRAGVLSSFFGKKPRRNLLCADALELPIATGAIDFVYSNLLLPYLVDIERFIWEMRRVLKLGGAFCISGLGVDTFKELREIGLNTYKFPDMHDIGDMLLANGFSNPVVDTEYITLEYDDFSSLLSDIKLIGCGNALSLSQRNPLRGQTMSFLKQELKFATDSNRKELEKSPKIYYLTIEVFVAHGWKDRNKIDLPKGHNVLNFMPKK